jgi:5-methyltetrahydropteroyltriglutamate--homocysteine methyltransferase
MVLAANLGFPRIGVKRELKTAVESYWAGNSTVEALQATAQELRARHWKLQAEKGIQHIPSNDFSFYDHVLDTTCMVGAVPERYSFTGNDVDLGTFFAMARGEQSAARDVVAMEMTKWLDTNYHYLVPEFEGAQNFDLQSRKAVDEFKEALALGIKTKPVLVGPVSYLLLGKCKGADFDRLDLLPKLLPVYVQLLNELKAAGAEWVQFDEPFLVTDLTPSQQKTFTAAYTALKASGLNILVATYFEALGDNLQTAVNLPVQALHIDLVRAPQQLDAVLNALPADKSLSLGLVDGRNIWRTDLDKALATAEKAVAKLGKERVIIAGSCSLLHSPVDLAEETKLDAEFKSWLAFATQKLEEIATLTNALNNGVASVSAQLETSRTAIASRSSSNRVHNPAVKQRLAAVTKDMATRKHPFAQRREAQVKALGLPLFPTTTIGSFPQTPEVRKYRADLKRGDITEAQYNAAMEEKIREVVTYQEEIGIDVLVHGEFERNDMVEYFGELLEGYAFTKNGWVQSYGSRCVKPPIIFGDVNRPTAMTVEWTAFAQSLTKSWMKGMLTGPITMLQWAFVRDDQPRSETCRQIALAIRDEVADLEKAGIKIIQIDEPAIREGLPIRKADWAAYLHWAVEAFHLSASVVDDSTQIHTHMCYSEFNDIMPSIGAMDADVISIETSRSQMELLESFEEYKYPNEIGPGVYDIHSPRIPTEAWMVDLLKKSIRSLDAQQIWVNPDCGLKTRKWAEVKPALAAMVNAARTMRKEVAGARTAAE